jgi:hypothetical protein
MRNSSSASAGATAAHLQSAPSGAGGYLSGGLAQPAACRGAPEQQLAPACTVALHRHHTQHPVAGRPGAQAAGASAQHHGRRKHGQRSVKRHLRHLGKVLSVACCIGSWHDDSADGCSSHQSKPWRQHDARQEAHRQRWELDKARAERKVQKKKRKLQQQLRCPGALPEMRMMEMADFVAGCAQTPAEQRLAQLAQQAREAEKLRGRSLQWTSSTAWGATQ